MKPRIGIVAGGGDCPGLNTVMNAVVAVLDESYEVLGFRKSFDGIIEHDYMVLNRENTTHFSWIGGTILKSVNKGRFSAKIGSGENRDIDKDLLDETYKHYNELGLEGLIVMGGDGTLAIALQLQNHGMNIIGIPKSIDNDLVLTDFTFGFWTSVDIIADALQRLHTTASSHDRIMICEVMGRHTGWMALYGGLAGGANMILLPEFGFSYEKIIETLEAREKRGRHSSVIVVGEGTSILDNKTTKKDGSDKNAISEVIYGGIGDTIASYINKNSHFEARNTTLGHIQRGGSPNAFDMALCKAYGSYAGRLVLDKKYGYVVSYRNNTMQSVPLDNALLSLKKVTPEHDVVQSAKAMGVSFGI